MLFIPVYTNSYHMFSSYIGGSVHPSGGQGQGLKSKYAKNVLSLIRATDDYHID